MRLGRGEEGETYRDQTSTHPAALGLSEARGASEVRNSPTGSHFEHRGPVCGVSELNFFVLYFKLIKIHLLILGHPVQSALERTEVKQGEQLRGH